MALLYVIMQSYVGLSTTLTTSMKFEYAVVAGAVSIAFWLGQLTFLVHANADAIERHVGRESHPHAAEDILRLQINQERLLKIESDLDALVKYLEENDNEKTFDE